MTKNTIWETPEPEENILNAEEMERSARWDGHDLTIERYNDTDFECFNPKALPGEYKFKAGDLVVLDRASVQFVAPSEHEAITIVHLKRFKRLPAERGQKKATERRMQLDYVKLKLFHFIAAFCPEGMEEESERKRFAKPFAEQAEREKKSYDAMLARRAEEFKRQQDRAMLPSQLVAAFTPGAIQSTQAAN